MKKAFILISLLVCAALLWNYWPDKPLPENSVVDRIAVYKSKRLLVAYSGDLMLKEYHVSLGGQPIGNKQLEGDMKTPEGDYIIDSKNANSKFFRNLGISYPNQNDKEQALSMGKQPGGDIKIHGLQSKYSFIGKFHRLVDWTNGCIALTNNEIGELYDHTKIGAKIEIKP